MAIKRTVVDAQTVEIFMGDNLDPALASQYLHFKFSTPREDSSRLLEVHLAVLRELRSLVNVEIQKIESRG